jgi:hypothetical protein
MKLDITSLYFNGDTKSVGNTASWGTALGQERPDYPISVEGGQEIVDLIAQNHIDFNPNTNPNHKANIKQLNDKIVVSSGCFNLVYVNNIKFEGPFYLLVIEETSGSHIGRKSLKYNNKIELDGVSNEQFYQKIQNYFGEESCWFAYDISAIDNNLHLSVIKVDDNNMLYEDAKTRKDHWESLINNYSDIIKQFKSYCLDVRKIKHEASVNEYIKAMPEVKSWFVENKICNEDFQIWNLHNDLSYIKSQLEGDFKESWKIAAQKNEKGDYGFKMAAWNRWTEFVEWNMDNKRGIKYFWMNANEDYWKIDQLKLNSEQSYTTHNNNGNSRGNSIAINSLKSGDLIVGYQTSPTSKVLALFEVTKAVYKNNDPITKGEFKFKKIAESQTRPGWDEIMKLEEVKINESIHMKSIKGGEEIRIPSNGSVQELTLLEFNEISELAKFKIIKDVNIVKEFKSKTTEANLIFSEQISNRFIASLCAKPFVILSGLSGSGKTKIAQSFVQWICESEKQYKIIPVGADWTNREPLVGYPNGLVSDEYITPDSGVIHLLMEAVKEENENKPFFLILDEMNLSHVERYFADFLSIMESNDTIKLYTGTKRKSLDGLEIDLEISWPKNVFIIGTVNIDETTYMFSPKVLDRANVIEFRITENEIKSFLANPGIPDLSKLTKQGVAMSESFLSIAHTDTIVKNDNLAKELVSFFKHLQPVGAEFGYRSASEIMQLVTKLKMLDKTITDNSCLDIAIMQKLLPKLHGSRSKLVKILIALSGLCLEGIPTEEFEKKFDDYYKNDFEGLSIKYPISFEKIIRMYKNVLSNGFTSYAEA